MKHKLLPVILLIAFIFVIISGCKTPPGAASSNTKSLPDDDSVQIINLSINVADAYNDTFEGNEGPDRLAFIANYPYVVCSNLMLQNFINHSILLGQIEPPDSTGAYRDSSYFLSYLDTNQVKKKINSPDESTITGIGWSFHLNRKGILNISVRKKLLTQDIADYNSEENYAFDLGTCKQLLLDDLAKPAFREKWRNMVQHAMNESIAAAKIEILDKTFDTTLVKDRYLGNCDDLDLFFLENGGVRIAHNCRITPPEFKRTFPEIIYPADSIKYLLDDRVYSAINTAPAVK